jgi:hypothetical protein
MIQRSIVNNCIMCVGSWMYYFHGWSLHEPVFRFGMINQLGTCRVQPDIAPKCRLQLDTNHITVTQMPKFHVAKRITTSRQRMT